MSKACLILDQNYADPDYLKTVNVSSYQTNFPITNCFLKNTRAKVWRSNGYWEVTSLNNKIVFSENGSTDLVASIAIANYTSTSSFLAAIKSAMDLVGAANYTVIQDSAKYIKITSDMTGGVSVFQLRCADSQMSGFNTLVGLANFNKLGATNYTCDFLRIHSYEYISFDFGLASKVNAVVLSSYNYNLMKISPQAQIVLEGNSTSNFSNPEFTTNLTVNEFSASVISKNALGYYRFWKIKIYDRSNPIGFIEVNNIFVGDAWAPAVGAVQFPLDLGIDDNSSITRSEFGEVFASIKSRKETFSFSYDFLSSADALRLKDIYLKFRKSRPMYFSFDSDDVYSSQPGEFIKYCTFENEPNISLSSPGYFSSKISLKEVA